MDFLSGLLEWLFPAGQMQFWLAHKLSQLAALTDLSAPQLLIALAVVFAAGMVRGFSGFALSALVMASIALIIPPIELIAVCWILEFCASLVLVLPGLLKAGENLLKVADMNIVVGLMVGSAIGWPLGLTLTNTVDVDVSKALALGLIIALAALQLAKVRAAFLATKPGLYASGLLAGIASGIASIGGMVVALYVLAREQAARQMRASLVAYLFLNAFVSGAILVWFGMMDATALTRGAVLVLPCMAGVFVGRWLFTPRLEPYYKPFCLVLLIGLAGAGLVRLTSGA